LIKDKGKINLILIIILLIVYILVLQLKFLDKYTSIKNNIEELSPIKNDIHMDALSR